MIGISPPPVAATAQIGPEIGPGTARKGGVAPQHRRPQVISL